jgi:hypothetical protein
MAALERRPPAIPLESATVPSGIDLDPAFSAIPVGHGRGGQAAAELQADVSETFAVRGFLEAETLEAIPESSAGRPIFADPLIAPFLTCGGSPPVGDAGLVAKKLRVATLGAGGLDGAGVAIAIMDTGLNLVHLSTQLGGVPRFDASNSWTPPGSTTAPGKHAVDHGTMCAFDALIAAPKATLLDYPILAGSAPGGSIAASTLSVALLGFAQLLAGWGVAFAPGGAARYGALVVSNSWGVYHPSWDFPPGHRGRYCDNPQHPFNVIVGTLAAAGADILFAAGNCGADCPDGRCRGRTSEAIMGANALGDVLTLAGCDTDDARVGYSSQGPSIAGMFREKPDVTSYTHFLGSEAFGKGSADSGTSTSCPVAAGCVAALRSKLPPSATPPANLFDQLRATARPAPGTAAAWNGDYGHGILDPVVAAKSLGLL